MITREEFLSKYPNIREGMDAYSEDGERLGKVKHLENDSLTIEKGFFFPKDFTFRYDNVIDFRDNRIYFNMKEKDLDHWKDESYAGWAEYDRIHKGEDIRIPLREEELEITKTSHQKGEVLLRKVVHTEMKTLTVPITSEDVVIERRAVTEAGEPERGAAEFREQEIRIPLMEEEIKVVKRAVIKEEVHARKESNTTQENFTAEVKKEDVEIVGAAKERPRRRAA